jgi:hypothetical protein
MVMPHKGLTPVAGRLSPAVWGNFPVKSCLARQGGSFFNYHIDDLGADASRTPAEDLRFVGDASSTLVVTADGGMAITAASGTPAENDGAGIAGLTKIDSSKRFAIEGSLNIDSIADNDNALFLGLVANRTADFLIDTQDGAGAIAASSVGAYVQRDKNGDETDSDGGVIAAAEILLATRGSSGAARIKKSGNVLVAGTATKIGLLHKGDGLVRLFVNDTLVLKEALPTDTVDGYPMVGVKAQATSPVLSLGLFFAAGVVD